jgi:hypothetical protein
MSKIEVDAIEPQSGTTVQQILDNQLQVKVLQEQDQVIYQILGMV